MVGSKSNKGLHVDVGGLLNRSSAGPLLGDTTGQIQLEGSGDTIAAFIPTRVSEPSKTVPIKLTA